MKKLSKPASAIDPALRHAVIYARVSSKAQMKLLKEYAAAQGFAVAKEYVGRRRGADMPLATHSSASLASLVTTGPAPQRQGLY
jgi:hypothetical protein